MTNSKHVSPDFDHFDASSHLFKKIATVFFSSPTIRMFDFAEVLIFVIYICRHMHFSSITILL